jgi:iron(III) transport system substrate-binding protein
MLKIKSVTRFLGLALPFTFMATAPALADGVVNIYSFRQPYLIEPLVDTFADETGIEVNIVFAKKGLTERLKAEGQNSPADLILTTDIGRLDELVENDVVQPITNAETLNNVPAAYRHPEGKWLGLTRRARVIAASKDRVKPGDINTYEDLADPKWKGTICTRSGSHVYQIGLLSSMIVHHGRDGAKTWLEGLKKNLARKPQGNDRAQVRAVAEGQCDFAVINSYYYGNMMKNPEQKKWAEAVNIILPNANDRGTHVNISGVAIAKYAPNKENAEKLINFLTSKEAQKLYADANSEYSVRPDVAPSDLLKSIGTLKSDPVDLEKIARNRAEAMKITDEVGYNE